MAKEAKKVVIAFIREENEAIKKEFGPVFILKNNLIIPKKRAPRKYKQHAIPVIVKPASREFDEPKS